MNWEDVTEEVEVEALEDGRRTQNGPPRPPITVSYAQTLDGRLATAGGSSQWISAEESLRVTHELRAAHDAILVGAGTACRDDPRLTVRLAEGHNPLRIVVDSILRLSLDAALLSEEAAPGTLLTERPVDRLVVCVGPKSPGFCIEATGELGVRDLDHSPELADVEVGRCGVDLLPDDCVVYPEAGSGGHDNGSLGTASKGT